MPYVGGPAQKSLVESAVDCGYEVEGLQEALQTRQLYRGPVVGQYDEEFTEALTAFQRQHNLMVDGAPGTRTMKAPQLY